MANYCAITTKNNLELLEDNKINFFLTRQLEEKEFQNYIKNNDKPYILDCDSFEIMQEKGKFEPADFEHVLDLAREYKPTYIILPDYFCDAEKTIEAARKYYDQTKEIAIPIGVVQGKNFEEIKKITREFWELGVRAFAVSFNAPLFEIESCRKSRIRRYKAFQEAIDELETEDDKMQYLHFLGLCQNINELFITPNRVNSLDSGKPVQMGREGLILSDTNFVENTIHAEGENNLTFNEEQVACAKANIAFVRWALSVESVTPLWYRDWTVSDLSPWKQENKLLSAAIGLTEEVGEFMSPINKSYRKKGNVSGASYEKLRGELSDIIFYINMILSELNLTYEELINYNYTKLNNRYKNGYNAKDAEAQVDKKVVKE